MRAKTAAMNDAQTKLAEFLRARETLQRSRHQLNTDITDFKVGFEAYKVRVAKQIEEYLLKIQMQTK